MVNNKTYHPFIVGVDELKDYLLTTNVRLEKDGKETDPIVKMGYIEDICRNLLEKVTLRDTGVEANLINDRVYDTNTEDKRYVVRVEHNGDIFEGTHKHRNLNMGLIHATIDAINKIYLDKKQPVKKGMYMKKSPETGVLYDERGTWI